MGTLDQIREGIHQAWESVAEGWESLRRKAGHALTWYKPEENQAKGGDSVARLLDNCPRWSLLAAELIEKEKQVQVRLEVPGMEPDDFSIEVINDALVVRGVKQVKQQQSEGRYFLLERAYGAFERAIQLPVGVDHEHARARYRRGVLTIDLPKIKSQEAKRIRIA